MITVLAQSDPVEHVLRYNGFVSDASPAEPSGSVEGAHEGIFSFLPHEPGEALKPLFELAVAGINVVGVVVLVWAVVCGVRKFLAAELRREFRRGPGGDRGAWLASNAQLRQDVGAYLLLGLELLIAADVIETMIDPTLETVAVLGAIVGIRIATSYFLGKEIQHARHEAGAAPDRNGSGHGNPNGGQEA